MSAHWICSACRLASEPVESGEAAAALAVIHDRVHHGGGKTAVVVTGGGGHRWPVAS